VKYRIPKQMVSVIHIPFLSHVFVYKVDLKFEVNYVLKRIIPNYLVFGDSSLLEIG
jgi:hypothetical protein